VGDNFFAPDTLTIAVSDTVTWTWSGLNPHSVTFADVGSGVRTTGSFQRFFGAAGSFPYTSTVTADSLMRGVIVVR
jgi:plastocyanin